MRENENGPGTIGAGREVTILTFCPYCNGTNDVTVSLPAYIRWNREGELIQNAFPELSPDDREQLMTGICPECWEKQFGE